MSPALCIDKIDFSTWRQSASSGHAQAVGILLCSGAAEFSLQRRFTLRAGELYVIPAGAPHAFFGAVDARTIGWTFDLEASFGRVMARNAVVPLDERNANELDGWLDRIDAERRNRDACSLALSEALYRAVNIECARVMGVASCSQYSKLVAGALQIISHEHTSNLRPRDIAARIGVTPAHLSHEVQRQTGRSPSDWIARARIDAAKMRLLSSAQSVSTIAMSVGYGDVSQLNRQFRRIAGVTPDAWRRANKSPHSAK